MIHHSNKKDDTMKFLKAESIVPIFNDGQFKIRLLTDTDERLIVDAENEEHRQQLKKRFNDSEGEEFNSFDQFIAFKNAITGK